ncbi:MAG: phage/plasmid primase, P4 family [Coriobacteriia bacterium]|nr:phage/plasmid primase, P4 family [Coriobacteriia bacterium]
MFDVTEINEETASDKAASSELFDCANTEQFNKTTGNAPDLKAAALEYARQGYPVFPCVTKGKKPLTANGYKNATTDPETIERWWSWNPTANIGLVTNNMLVVDIDGELGAESLAAWEAIQGTLPETATARTGGGGSHRFYRVKEPVKCRTAALEGVDIRADGGYTIVAPSIHQSGAAYAWKIPLEQIAYASEAVIKLATHRSTKKPVDSLPEGNRNSGLTSLGGRLRVRGASDVLIHEALHEANRVHCTPPLGQEETQGIADSITGYPKGELAVDHTGAGLSERYAARYCGLACYCPAIGWLVYNGIVWQRSDLEALQLMDSLTRDMLVDANTQLALAHDGLAQAEIDGNKEAKKEAGDKLKRAREYRSYALKCRSTSTMSGALNHARCHLAIDLGQLDNDPYLLNTPTGTVDLRTGITKPHNPKDFCTKVTAVEPADSEEDMLLQDFLSLIFSGDRELMHYVKVALGSGLIGKVFEEAMLLAYGDGCNGKSTLFNTVANVIGSYSGKFPAEALTTKGKSARHDLAELLAVRLAFAAETEEGMRLSNSVLKQIASTDNISAERKFHDPFDFDPSHLMVLSTNHLPKVSSIDYGTWRRIKAVPFGAKIQTPDTSFAGKLLKESGGAMLRWLAEGAKEFIENGYKFPSCAAVDRAIEIYKASNDWLGAFLEECCVLGEGQAGGRELYSAYHFWASQANDYIRSKADFKAALENAGLEWRKTNKGVRWYGISLVTPTV